MLFYQEVGLDPREPFICQMKFFQQQVYDTFGGNDEFGMYQKLCIIIDPNTEEDDIKIEQLSQQIDLVRRKE